MKFPEWFKKRYPLDETVPFQTHPDQTSSMTVGPEAFFEDEEPAPIILLDVFVRDDNPYGGVVIMSALVMHFSTGEIIVGKARDKAELEKLASEIKANLGMI